MLFQVFKTLKGPFDALHLLTDLNKNGKTKLKHLLNVAESPSASVPKRLCEGEMIHQFVYLPRTIKREMNFYFT